MKIFICFMIWKCLHLCPNQVENHRAYRRQRNQTRPIIDQVPTPEITALIHLGGQSLTSDHLPRPQCLIASLYFCPFMSLALICSVRKVTFFFLTEKE
jgi:hypothetical protein